MWQAYPVFTQEFLCRITRCSGVICEEKQMFGYFLLIRWRDCSTIFTFLRRIDRVSYNTQSWERWHFCTTSNGNKLEHLELNPFQFTFVFLLLWMTNWSNWLLYLNLSHTKCQYCQLCVLLKNSNMYDIYVSVTKQIENKVDWSYLTVQSERKCKLN